MTISPEPLHVTRRGAVLEVVLDRPKANAIDGATSRPTPTTGWGGSAASRSSPGSTSR